MPSQRSRRVAEAIQHEISALLLRGLKDPRIGFVTITGVEMNPDLHLARVFYSVVGDDEAKKSTGAGLKSSIPFIKAQLGRQLHMKYVPDLVFQYDSSIEYGSRIETLLRDALQEQSDD